MRKNLLVTVGRAADVPEGRGATVELADGKELALYNVGGEFYAIENFCPHRARRSRTANFTAAQSDAIGTVGVSTCATGVA